MQLAREHFLFYFVQECLPEALHSKYLASVEGLEAVGHVKYHCTFHTLPATLALLPLGFTDVALSGWSLLDCMRCDLAREMRPLTGLQPPR